MAATAPPRLATRPPPPPPPPPPGPAPVVGSGAAAAQAQVLQATPVPWRGAAPMQGVQPPQPIQALPTPAPVPASAKAGWPAWKIVLVILGGLFALCVMGQVCGGAMH